jgi:D-glycero-D-manno-heptose 1,7-bisphosphate phosphatase
MIKAVFFDRDGVINDDTKYLHEISKFKFKEGIFDLMSHLQSLSYLLFIITNQSGINRQYFSESDYTELTNHMLSEFDKQHISIENIYMCPHTPTENCSCRKPKPTYILTAKKDYNLDLKNSWLIGDKTSDIQCGINAGISNLIFVKGLYPEPTLPCSTVKTLYEAKSLITS